MKKWKFINSTLQYFNFGDSFNNWIKLLYSNISSQVVNNGWASESFLLSRWVRQGCPLSPYIFILCSEILAKSIRQNTKIQGIKIGNCDYTISQYADDTAITILAMKECLEEVIKVFDCFEKYSGLKVNYEKTEILPIGRLKGQNFKLNASKDLKWTDGPVNMLGIKITHDIKNFNKYKL